METLYSIKDEKSEFYIQIKLTKNIWKYLDNLAHKLFNENIMIDEYYRGEIKNNDYFSFKKDGIYLGIIMKEKRAYIIILGLLNNSKIKELTFKYYKL